MNGGRKGKGSLNTLMSSMCKGGIAYKVRALWRRSRQSSQIPGGTPGTRRRAAESIVGTWEGMRDAERQPRKLREIGEPCALKGASTVRGGEVRKGTGLSYYLARDKQVKS